MKNYLLPVLNKTEVLDYLDSHNTSRKLYVQISLMANQDSVNIIKLRVYKSYTIYFSFENFELAEDFFYNSNKIDLNKIIKAFEAGFIHNQELRALDVKELGSISGFKIYNN